MSQERRGKAVPRPKPKVATLQDDVARNIRFYRKRKRMNQRELAKKMGLTYLSVSNLERFHTDISLSTLEKYAKVLEVQVIDLTRKEFKGY